jgi:hypothetical protein
VHRSHVVDTDDGAADHGAAGTAAWARLGDGVAPAERSVGASEDLAAAEGAGLADSAVDEAAEAAEAQDGRRVNYD